MFRNINTFVVAIPDARNLKETSMIKLLNRLDRISAFLALWLLVVGYISAQTPENPPTDEEVIAKVDEYMAATSRVDGFSGSILLARDGKPLVSKGYGMANLELGVPNAPRTIYRLGSITKQFTGMAIAMQQERGKLSASDPICKYLAECPATWQPLTIRHLLTHTSGIPNYTSFPDFAKTAISPMTTAEMIGLLKEKPLEFTPGEKYAYSNSGYFLLGVIIERTSGRTYAEFLQDNIFTPLGMKNSGYDSPLQIIKDRAAGYQRQSGTLINAAYMDMSIPYSAGSLYSTTGDLLIWDQALYTEKLVSKKALDEIFTPLKGDTGYGFGWNIGKRFGRRTIGHSGGIYGFVTQISRYPADRITIVVLSNFQGSPVSKIANDLAAMVFGGAYEIPRARKEIALEPKVLERYIGQYQIAPTVLITLALENGKLVGQLGSQPKFLLIAESDTIFFSKDINVQLTFAKDTQGQVTSLTIKQGGSDVPASKVK